MANLSEETQSVGRHWDCSFHGTLVHAANEELCNAHKPPLMIMMVDCYEIGILPG